MPVRPALLLALAIGLLAPLAPATEPAPGAVEIVATKRTFTPAVVTLRLGEPAILAIRNTDEDLHAFVPLLLLQRANVQVSGNGAPEFNEAGLVRILLAPKGRTELRFTPKKAGTFFYICDLPGHHMRAEIVVQ